MSDDLGGTDILKRLRVLGVAGPAEQILACQWGRGIRTEDDPGPCPEQAVRITVLHPDGGNREVDVRLCQRHTDLVLAMTTPHGSTT